MAHINLKTQGVRGGSPSWSENKGYVAVFIDDTQNRDHIIVDSFEGIGENYKRREQALISIDIYGVTWEGTKDELKEMILKTK